MKTVDQIREAFNAPIPREEVQTRSNGNFELSYMAGWQVIDLLNQILGQGNWGYQTEEMKLVYSGTNKGKYGDVHVAHYIAKVNLSFKMKVEGKDEGRFGGQYQEFSDYGYGNGQDKRDPGACHELAVKEAVTDGLKRCAKNLGLRVGLALYDKTQKNVSETVTRTATVKRTSGANGTAPTPSNGNGAVIGKQIDTTAKVAIAKRKFSSIGDIKTYLQKTYKVDSKAQLTPPQAKEFLGYLESLIA